MKKGNWVYENRSVGFPAIFHLQICFIYASLRDMIKILHDSTQRILHLVHLELYRQCIGVCPFVIRIMFFFHGGTSARPEECINIFYWAQFHYISWNPLKLASPDVLLVIQLLWKHKRAIWSNFLRFVFQPKRNRE